MSKERKGKEKKNLLLFMVSRHSHLCRGLVNVCTLCCIQTWEGRGPDGHPESILFNFLFCLKIQTLFHHAAYSWLLHLSSLVKEVVGMNTEKLEWSFWPIQILFQILSGFFLSADFSPWDYFVLFCFFYEEGFLVFLFLKLIYLF